MLMLLPLIVTLGGGFLLCKLRCFFIFHPIKTAKATVEVFKHKESFLSLTLALAGTLGVGNIVGVAVGIILGGPGSVLWLIISSLFASVLKYSESTLACDCGSQGMMSVISRVFPRGSFARFYALLCLLLSLSIGASLQTNSVVTSLDCVFVERGKVVPIFFATIIVLLIKIGQNHVKKLTSIIIPMATIAYIIVCSATIFSRFSEITRVFSMILSSAFDCRGAFGGALGFISGAAVREGYARGLLSNEAGSGTSALSHSDTQYLHPTTAGVVGVCEVIFDTVILCPLTAFSILLTVPDTSSYTTGMSLVIDSIGSTTAFSTPILLVCISAFAISTVVCWYSYGSICFSYLFRRGKAVYSACFIAAILFSSYFDDVFLICITDYILLALTSVSVSAIIKNSDRLVSLSEQAGFFNSRRR